MGIRASGKRARDVAAVPSSDGRENRIHLKELEWTVRKNCRYDVTMFKGGILKKNAHV